MASSVRIESSTTTTKALLLSVTAPRKIAAKKEPVAEEPETVIEKLVETDDEASTNSVRLAKTLLKSIKAPLKQITTKKESVSDDEEEATSVEEEKKQEQEDIPVEEEVIKSAKEEQSEPMENDIEKGSPVVADTAKDDKEESKEESIYSAIAAEEEGKKTTGTSEEKEESTVDDEEIQEEVVVTPEQAAAVVESVHDPMEAEINVEELLRITFQTLLEEFHLLTIPTYSYVAKKQKDVTAASAVGNTLLGRIENDDSSQNNWVRLEVMVYPEKLGILLERLEHIGIGTNVGTLSVYKAELCRTASPYLLAPEKEESTAEATSSTESAATENNNTGETDEAERATTDQAIAEARKEWKNAATRLRIEQVREQICEQAQLSFDFISLLSIASILAGIGLITNNTVVIVASMLVSPIMGPVMGICFGSRVKDWPLVKISLLNETLALLGCVFIGGLIAICAGFTNMAAEEWPTPEMLGRGDPIGLITGIAVAIPSGMGVCLSILGGNTSSLVGVAISASLLPPAVNTGICFVFAVLVSTGAAVPASSLSAEDFAIIGAISFALTVLNIVCIWVAGIVMFEIKEVAPAKSKSAFWAKDIKVARELNTKATDGKPPPVDFNVIQKGAKKALIRKKSGDRSGDKKTGSRVRPTQRRHSTYERQSLGTAFAMQPNRRQVHFGGSGDLSPVLSRVSEAEEDADVRYVGLEDMAGLLGFDEESDDEEAFVPAFAARKFGHGRYI